MLHPAQGRHLGTEEVYIDVWCGQNQLDPVKNGASPGEAQLHQRLHRQPRTHAMGEHWYRFATTTVLRQEPEQIGEGCTREV